MYKVQKDLEATSGDVPPVMKLKNHSQRSNSIKAPEFAKRVQDTVVASSGMSLKTPAGDPQVSEGTICKCEDRVVHVQKQTRTTIVPSQAITEKNESSRIT